MGTSEAELRSYNVSGSGLTNRRRDPSHRGRFVATGPTGRCAITRPRPDTTWFPLQSCVSAGPTLTLKTAHAKHHRPVLGILLKLASVVLLSGMSASVKALGKDIPSGEIIFIRGVIAVCVLAIIAWRSDGLHLLKTRNWRSHALRSLSGTASMFFLFAALTMIPLADVTAISFTQPMFLTVLAMVFLGERIHRFRWTALGIGFLGVLIMVGPYVSFTEASSAGALTALGAAMFSALAMMFLRGMSGGEHAITITFYFSLTFMVCGGLTVVQGWPMPTPEQWVLIALAGLFGVFGQLLMTFSYRYAEASTIAPLDYTNIIMAVILGYLIFGEIPALSVWIGAPLVIGAGLIILWREYRLKKQLSSAALP
jgi:drug/metabolite transporter (DMT)-like permease